MVTFKNFQKEKVHATFALSDPEATPPIRVRDLLNKWTPCTRLTLPVPSAWERFVTSVAPAGSIWSNAEDMARYLVMQLNRGVAPDGTRLVSEANLDITQTVEIPMADQSMGYGMGWIVASYRGQPMISHSGGTQGFSSDCTFLPEAGLGIFVVNNRGGAANFNNSVRDYVIELAFGQEHAAAAMYLQSESDVQQVVAQYLGQPSTEPIDPEAVAPYLGEYARGVTVELRDGELWIASEVIETQLLPVGEAEFAGAGLAVSIGVRFAEADGTVTLALFDRLPFDPSIPLTLEKIG